jgi:predicted HicB family RNase H-like nuclease
MATKRFVLRIKPDTHRRLKIEAARMSVSLTDYTDEVLKRGMARGKPEHKDDGR